MPLKVGSSGYAVSEYPTTVNWFIDGDFREFAVTYVLYPLGPDGNPLRRVSGTLSTSSKTGQTRFQLAGSFRVFFRGIVRSGQYRVWIPTNINNVQIFIEGTNRGNDTRELNGQMDFEVPGVEAEAGTPEAPAPRPGTRISPATEVIETPVVSRVGPQYGLLNVNAQTGSKYRIITPEAWTRTTSGRIIPATRYESVRVLSAENVASFIQRGYTVEPVPTDTATSPSKPYGPSVVARAEQLAPGESPQVIEPRGRRVRRTIQQVVSARQGAQYERAIEVQPRRRVVR